MNIAPFSFPTAPKNEESHICPAKFPRRYSRSPLWLAPLALQPANTVEGAGEDIQIAGEEVEETAEELNDGNPETP